MQLAASLAVAATLAVVGCLAADSGVAYDNAAAGYDVTYERWLKQRDLRSCLSGSPADILFVVDGSESVGLSDFHLVVKSLLVDTVSKLRLGPNLVEVGVLVFSDQVSQTIPIGRFEDKLELLAAVSSLAYVGSYTSLDAAVEGSASELQRRRSELNRTATVQVAERRKTIVVFVTDGWANHGSSQHLQGFLRDLQLQVTGVLALGLENSNADTLRLLATDPTLVFDPTTYPDYLTSLFHLLNSRCSDTCYKYDQEKEEVHKAAMTLAQYTNSLVNNYALYKRQEQSLLQYTRQLNASTAALEADILRTCERSDESMLEKIVDLRKEIDKKTNDSEFGGFTIDVFISKLIEKVSSLQEETFEQKRKLTIEKSRREALLLEEEQFEAEAEAKLRSQAASRQANEVKLQALEQRIVTYTQQLQGVESTMNKSAKVSEELLASLQEQEAIYSRRLEEMQQLAETHATLLSVGRGGSAQLVEAERQIAFCRSYLRHGETVLFAIRCGSGAEFDSLFSRDASSFDQEAFNGLSESLPMYKSPFLRHLHTMGYFPEATLQFIVGGEVVATLQMDTSRFELANVFTTTRVISSFPWVAAYINSVYRGSLAQFRLRQDSEFLLIFGDLGRYRRSGRCSDLIGVYAVLQRQHRCFPDAATFPQVYVSSSPFGGQLATRIDELRLVTKQPPTEKKLPTVATEEREISEVLLFVRSGAGFLQPLLLSPRYSAASVLADVDDVSELSQHYKSSLLAKASLRDFSAVRMELFDASATRLAMLEFRGPFEQSLAFRGSPTELGSSREAWDWFQPRFLHSAEPFDLQQLRSATFRFYDGKEFFSIGHRMSGDCDSRRYFLTIVDSSSPCQCFVKAPAPCVFFSNDKTPRSCSQLQRAHSLRITGILRQLLG